MNSIGLLLRATEPEWKSALKILRYYVSLQTQGSVCCKWAAIHCSSWRSSSTLRWYLRVTKCGVRRLIHGLVKLTQFCLSFIALWSQNGSFQTLQSCQFSNRSLFRYLWSWFLGNDRNNIISSARGRDGILANSPRCDTGACRGEIVPGARKKFCTSMFEPKALSE